MIYDARQIANWFLERASNEGRNLSIMSLLKLTYIAHGWHLETQNAPLFQNKIEAWQYGPVIPDVYHGFHRQGVTVTGPKQALPALQADEQDAHLLDQIWQIYGSLSPFRLSELTHEPDGPWDIATKTGGFYAPITDALIRQHYMLKRQQSQNNTAAA